jgi:hypothetical protein
VGEEIHIDSRAWTGDLTPGPPRDLPPPRDTPALRDLLRFHQRPGRTKTALILTVFGLMVISYLYGLAWMVCWGAAGSPPILTVLAGWPDAAALVAAAFVLLATRRHYDRPGRLLRAALMFGVVLSIGQLADFEWARSTSASTRTVRLFVVARSDAGIDFRSRVSGKFQLEPQLETVDSSGLHFSLVVPSSVLERAVAGDTCITAAIPATNFVHRPLVSMRLESSGDGTGSYLSRDDAKRRCLAGAPSF